MTREEAIHILNNLKPTNTKSSFDAYVVGKAITMAIKALEQEPILDKIRTEIEEEQKGYPPSADEYKTFNKVLQIIDKHIGDTT